MATVLQGRWTRLRLLEASDLPRLRSIEASGERLTQFRLRGVAQNSEAYATGLTGNALCQFAIVERLAGQLVGYVTCYGPDFRHGWAKVAATTTSDGHESWALEGVMMFLDYVFNEFPFRKLYADVLEPNLATFRSILDAGPFVTEGQLTEHEYLHGDYVDLYVIGVRKEDWLLYRANEPRLLALLRSR